MDAESIFGVLIFSVVSAVILHWYYTEVVEVYHCKNESGYTTYVSKKKPDTRLKVGTCEINRMTNLDYHEIRTAQRNVYLSR